MAELIVNTVLAILGIRLGLYCLMAWQRLRQKFAVSGAAPSGRERFFLVALPLVALAMAGIVVWCGLAVMRALGPAAV